MHILRLYTTVNQTHTKIINKKTVQTTGWYFHGIFQHHWVIPCISPYSPGYNITEYNTTTSQGAQPINRSFCAYGSFSVLPWNGMFCWLQIPYLRNNGYISVVTFLNLLYLKLELFYIFSGVSFSIHYLSRTDLKISSIVHIKRSHIKDRNHSRQLPN